jgi:hypothetical protein
MSLKIKNTLETLSLSIIDKGLKQNSISFCIAKKKLNKSLYSASLLILLVQ